MTSKIWCQKHRYHKNKLDILCIKGNHQRRKHHAVCSLVADCLFSMHQLWMWSLILHHKRTKELESQAKQVCKLSIWYKIGILKTGNSVGSGGTSLYSEQENQTFQVTLSYKTSMRPARATCHKAGKKKMTQIPAWIRGLEHIVPPLTRSYL